jgi:hypothetical protein
VVFAQRTLSHGFSMLSAAGSVTKNEVGEGELTVMGVRLGTASTGGVHR